MMRWVIRGFLVSFIFLLNLNLSFPLEARAAEWTYLGNDGDGTHYYWLESHPSPGVIRVWGHLVYSQAGRQKYIAKRQANGMSTEGFDRVNHRNVLYEMNCFSSRYEYTILEVSELTKDGKRLDYAKAGSYKDWSMVPERSMLEKLGQATCPARRE